MLIFTTPYLTVSLLSYHSFSVSLLNKDSELKSNNISSSKTLFELDKKLAEVIVVVVMRKNNKSNNINIAVSMIWEESKRSLGLQNVN